MTVERLGKPCRNFNILGIARLVDPRDGREKVVLSNFASGATGNLVIVDPSTGGGESIPLPGDEGAWAILNLDDETLLLGTCAGFGYLHRLDLRSRRWAEPLRDRDERYIWNLVRASDGMVYGGTWPGGRLLRYDPARHVLDNLGPVSDNPGNMYARTVHGGTPGLLLVDCGYAEPHVAAWDLAAGQVRRIGRPGAKVREATARCVCIETGGSLDFFDARTLERIERDPGKGLEQPVKPPFAGMGRSVVLADGSVFATRGQEYCRFDPAAVPDPRAIALLPIPTERPATRIHTTVSDERGRIWGSSGFGTTIFWVDPSNGDLWNSSGVVDSGGEVYGMAFVDGRLFMSAYAGGDHAVYDPDAPWDQLGNVNPRTLASVAPGLIRPSGRSVIGPDGNFWTGWMARYGARGGGLTRIDVRTLAMTCWTEPFREQALEGLAADDQYVYAVTGPSANGLPEHRDPLQFVVVGPDGTVAWRHVFASGERTHAICTAAGRALVAVDRELRVFDPSAMRFERSIPLEEPCQCAARWDTSAVAALCNDRLLRVDPVSGAVSPVCQLPGAATTMTVAPDGTLYAAIGTELYRLAG